ncbi:hypothetical protein [Streptomyces sp. AcH 505]|uniref:hypothetical protein n=1 Tax=Streptomyces sp. AcH 505 TaxID=352211 RepID=UPI000A94C2FE
MNELTEGAATPTAPDPLDAHFEHLAHIDGCGFCRESRDGSMCHEGHTLWRASREARA